MLAAEMAESSGERRGRGLKRGRLPEPKRIIPLAPAFARFTFPESGGTCEARRHEAREKIVNGPRWIGSETDLSV